MATTASQAKNGLNAIALRIQAERSRLAGIQEAAATSADNLTTMATEYATLISDINTASNQLPNDEALKTYKAEAALLQNEFNALLAKAQQFETAVSGITF